MMLPLGTVGVGEQRERATSSLSFREKAEGSMRGKRKENSPSSSLPDLWGGKREGGLSFSARSWSRKKGGKKRGGEMACADLSPSLIKSRRGRVRRKGPSYFQPPKRKGNTIRGKVSSPARRSFFSLTTRKEDSGKGKEKGGKSGCLCPL